VADEADLEYRVVNGYEYQITLVQVAGTTDVLGIRPQETSNITNKYEHYGPKF